MCFNTNLQKKNRQNAQITNNHKTTKQKNQKFTFKKSPAEIANH